MKVQVTEKAGLTIQSGPRVTLDMDIEEFALLEQLRYRAVTGHHPLRDEIERGFQEVLDALPRPWEQRVRRVAHSIGGNRLTDAQNVSQLMRKRGL